MYNVSTEYLSAVRALSRTDRLTGILELTNGTTIELKDNRIFERTLELVHDIVSGEEIEFGSAMLKQLSFSLRTHQDRYVFYDARITPYYGVKLADGTWFDVPLGAFEVAEAERGGNYVQLVAYDDLLKFDKEYDGTAMTGTCYEVLLDICDICGVPFGLTEEALAEFPNGDSSIYIDAKTGCTKYRDCLKVISQKLGAFVTTDRAGNLILKRFGKEPITSLRKSNRFKTTLADYICRYAGLTVRAGEKSWSSYDESIESGLELILPDAPAWDYGTDEALQGQTDALFGELKAISYTPAKMTVSNDPAIECGDMIALETDTGTVNTLVTGFTWRYRARMELDSTGANPYLKAIKPQKSVIIRELEKQTEYNKLIFYSFSNPQAITISGTEVEPVANVTFVTVENTSAMFIAQLPVTVDIADEVTEKEEEKTVTVKDSTGAETTILDANGNPLTLTVLAKDKDTKPGTVDVEIFYYMDGTQEDYTLVERLTAGPHILSLFYPFSGLKANQNYTWDVRIRAASGSVTIAKNALKATITGRGLAASTVWDGTLSFEEVVPPISLQSSLTLVDIAEEVSTMTQVPTPADFVERVAAISLRSRMTLGTLSERVSTTEIRQKKTIDTAEWDYTDRYVEIVGSEIMARVEWRYESEEQTIDSGRMTAVKAVTNDLGSVEEVTVSG